jgi:hypothetical protein
MIHAFKGYGAGSQGADLTNVKYPGLAIIGYCIC